MALGRTPLSAFLLEKLKTKINSIVISQQKWRVFFASSFFSIHNLLIIDNLIVTIWAKKGINPWVPKRSLKKWMTIWWLLQQSKMERLKEWGRERERSNYNNSEFWESFPRGLLVIKLTATWISVWCGHEFVFKRKIFKKILSREIFREQAQHE